MQQYGNSFFSTPPHLDFQGSQKNFWRAPTLNKAISDLKEKKKKKVQFNTGNWQRFKLHLILAKAVHQSWGEMWIFSSSQMPNYSFLLILLLRSCQGCTHPLSPGIWIPLKKHLNSVTWGLCSHHRVTSQEPLQMTVSDKEHLMLEWCCLLPVEVPLHPERISGAVSLLSPDRSTPFPMGCLSRATVWQIIASILL